MIQVNEMPTDKDFFFDGMALGWVSTLGIVHVLERYHDAILPCRG